MRFFLKECSYIESLLYLVLFASIERFLLGKYPVHVTQG